MSFEFALLWLIFAAGLVVGTMMFLNRSDGSADDRKAR
jgi:hypothetical protein